MESLLTASETHAFKAFLSQINYDSALVDSLVASADWSSLGDGIPVPQPSPGREALAKATKDLMSLPAADPPSSTPVNPTATNTAANNNNSNNLPHHQLLSSFQGWHDALRGRSRTFTVALSAPRTDSSSSRHSFSLLDDVVSPRSPLSPSPPTSSSTSTTTPIASTPSSSSTVSKRPSSSNAALSSSNKRPRTSTSSASTTTIVNGNASTSTKPALLTPSQKKANHIQSEQKRRANIRRGYEALCETVPALVDAIRAEDEAMAAAAACGGDPGREVERERSGGRKKRVKARAAAGGASGGGGGSGVGLGDGEDKTDGRAGPRSENVVLGKTVEHIQDLLAQRDDLVARLTRARTALPPGHPDRREPMDGGGGGEGVALWEREWTGGGEREGEDGSEDEGA